MSADLIDEPATETRAERVSYLAIAGIEKIARTLPTRTGRVLFRWAGGVAYHLAKGPRAVVARNQAQVLGRSVEDPMVIAATKEAFQLYARYWFDAFHILDWSDERIRREFVFEGLEHVARARAAGTGAICVMPHTGNWDAAGKAMVANGHPVVAVVEHLKPERLFQLFLRQRRALNVEPVGLVEGGHIGQKLAASLAENVVVALVSDRDLTGRGVEVEMFGAPRRLPVGPALLSISSGAPILVCDVVQLPGGPVGWRCVIHPLPDVERTGDRRRDVTAVTRELAKAFEAAISAAPTDWHMFQPAWED